MPWTAWWLRRRASSTSNTSTASIDMRVTGRRLGSTSSMDTASSSATAALGLEAATDSGCETGTPDLSAPRRARGRRSSNLAMHMPVCAESAAENHSAGGGNLSACDERSVLAAAAALMAEVEEETQTDTDSNYASSCSSLESSQTAAELRGRATAAVVDESVMAKLVALVAGDADSSSCETEGVGNAASRSGSSASERPEEEEEEEEEEGLRHSAELRVALSDGEEDEMPTSHTCPTVNVVDEEEEEEEDASNRIEPAPPACDNNSITNAPMAFTSSQLRCFNKLLGVLDRRCSLLVRHLKTMPKRTHNTIDLVQLLLCSFVYMCRAEMEPSEATLAAAISTANAWLGDNLTLERVLRQWWKMVRPRSPYGQTLCATKLELLKRMEWRAAVSLRTLTHVLACIDTMHGEEKNARKTMHEGGRQELLGFFLGCDWWKPEPPRLDNNKSVATTSSTSNGQRGGVNSSVSSSSAVGKGRNAGVEGMYLHTSQVEPNDISDAAFGRSSRRSSQLDDSWETDVEAAEEDDEDEVGREAGELRPRRASRHARLRSGTARVSVRV